MWGLPQQGNAHPSLTVGMRIFTVCPDSGCACYSLKSQYPQIMTSLLFRKRGHFLFSDTKKTTKNVRCIVKGVFQYAGSHTTPLKMTLTTKEAAEYSNIGINKIDSMLRTPNCPFVLFVGTKKLVKRKEFEQYISQKLVI